MGYKDALPLLEGSYNFLLWNNTAVIAYLIFFIDLSYKLPIYY